MIAHPRDHFNSAHLASRCYHHHHYYYYLSSNVRGMAAPGAAAVAVTTPLNNETCRRDE
jgi:hypothetical protein